MKSTIPTLPAALSTSTRTIWEHAQGKLQASFLEPFLPAIFFFAGVMFDSLTLTRIDRLSDNLILLLYLSILGLFIILTGRFELGLIPPVSDRTQWNFLSLVHQVHPHLAKVLQFLFGGLFSAYAILYSQSASSSTCAIFLGVIVTLLIANEFLQTRYSSLKMLVGLFSIVTLSFFTFFLPVLTGWMNALVFLSGALITIIIVWNIVRMTLQGIPNLSVKSTFTISLPAFVLVGLCSGLYFLNWIPPIPLSLKYGGIYHHIEKTAHEYTLRYEDGPWYAYWKQSDDRMPTNVPVYCFSSVFAPVTLDTTITHHWQWRPFKESASFITTDRIPITITGGREQGYRMYSMKRRIQPGEWRVDVEAEDQRLIGRMTFVALADYSPTHMMTTITR